MALSLVAPKRYKRHGLLGLGERLPAPIQGVNQRVAYDAPPETCDKCKGRDIASDPIEPRRYSCFGCGSDWWLVEAPWRRPWPTPAG